ncbi:MAG: GNAT family N-acetyltransferase [Burkholderiaceae bacterium]|nr:GNAT family N-acetyltransferase [Rhodoferax sp.]MCP5283467.1 GNAT family N-acetyltransferase [Burkholderiaceae bacterium]
MPDLIAADAVASDALHAAFTAAFADYVAGPFRLDPTQWPGFIARQCVNLALSRVALDDQGAPAAFAFVAERPAQQRWRLATMGAVPAARGRGDAAALLQDLIARATEAQQHGLELEVFAQNPRAVKLYERHGFVAVAALQGHEAAALGGAATAPPADVLSAVSRAEALAWLERAEAAQPELPLQLAAPVVARADGWTAWQRGSAQLIFGDAADGGLVIRSLVDLDATQRDAQVLAAALRQAHPERRVTLPPLLPDRLGGEALQRAGFTRQPLHQWWMHRALP